MHIFRYSAAFPDFTLLELSHFFPKLFPERNTIVRHANLLIKLQHSTRWLLNGLPAFHTIHSHVSLLYTVDSRQLL